MKEYADELESVFKSLLAIREVGRVRVQGSEVKVQRSRFRGQGSQFKSYSMYLGVLYMLNLNRTMCNIEAQLQISIVSKLGHMQNDKGVV